ncbi:MAG TPA: hypothetical protein VM493_13035 [Vicinamibacterales bacterium]|jgi:hypothetical protein|nr:hypothetical protein [Vicinamibacterales bacterium]
MSPRSFRVILYTVGAVLAAAILGFFVLALPVGDPQALPSSSDRVPARKDTAVLAELKKQFCRNAVADADLDHRAAALDETLRKNNWIKQEQRILRVYRNPGAPSSPNDNWTVVIGSDFDAELDTVVLTPCTGEVKGDRRL